MLIYPAIDLINGKAVRLTKGDYSTTEVFYDNPIDALRSFKKDGATQLHLVDLDGAKDGTTANFEVIKALVKEGDTFIEVGGGIRTTERIRKYLDIGVNRVILGTIAVTDFEFVKKSVKEFGTAIAIGVDAKNAKVAVNGWKTITNVSSFDFCEKCRDVRRGNYYIHRHCNRRQYAGDESRGVFKAIEALWLATYCVGRRDLLRGA
jgi:Phosphoribosylformimino-5-aminoimidazole carboxamide ribonucleotide (ProFAR) isomerase